MWKTSHLLPGVKKQCWFDLSWPNNHSIQAAGLLKKLAEDVQFYYGHRYQRATDYLHALANNAFWQNAELEPLPFHSQGCEPVGVGAPRYILHQAVLNALAPTVPLRAVFGGDRRL